MSDNLKRYKGTMIGWNVKPRKDGNWCKYEDVKKLEKEHNITKEALEFYADKENWQDHYLGYQSACRDDNGYKARVALTKLSKE